MNQFAILAMGGQTITVINCAPGYEVEVIDSNGIQVAQLNAPGQFYRAIGFQTYFVIPRALGPAAAVTGVAFAGGQYPAMAGGANVITVTIL